MEYVFNLTFAVEALSEQEAAATAAHVHQHVAGLQLHPAIVSVDGPELVVEDDAVETAVPEQD